MYKAARKRVGVRRSSWPNAGNTQTFVSQGERWKRRIDGVELVEFAEALGVPPLELLGEYLNRRSVGCFPKTKRGN